MASNWKEMSIRDTCIKSMTGGTPSSRNVDFYEGGTIPWLNTKEVDFCRIYKTENHITELGLQKSSAKWIPENSVIVAMYGATAGKVALNKIPLTTNQACCNLVIDNNKANYEFIYYYLSDSYLKLANLSNGAAQQNLNTSIINNFPILLPPLAEQKAIAHILGKLDNKIELNRQMNETLEAMAQALFKSWFVDFDPVIDNALLAGNNIPDELEERAELRQAQLNSGKANTNSEINDLFPSEFEFTEELGWIPRGWEVSKIEKEYETVGGGTPSTKNPDFWEDGDIHWTTPKDLSGKQSKILLDTDRKITELGLAKISSGLLPVNTVLMSSRAPVGYLALAKIPVAINQGYIAFKCNKTLTSEYAIQWAESEMAQIKQRAGGTTFSEISKRNFRDIDILVPSSELVERYSEAVKSIYDKVTANEKQSNTLANLRDTLLPKLMSGELRIPDNEKLAENI